MLLLLLFLLPCHSPSLLSSFSRSHSPYRPYKCASMTSSSSNILIVFSCAEKKLKHAHKDRQTQTCKHTHTLMTVPEKEATCEELTFIYRCVCVCLCVCFCSGTRRKKRTKNRASMSHFDLNENNKYVHI